MSDYQLLDHGNGRKWERFGEFILERPCPIAVWKPKGTYEADAIFHRKEGDKWTYRRTLPLSWKVEIGGVRMKVAPTEFGHLGVFPEHVSLWNWMRERLFPGAKVLNLFAYSGGATLIAAKKGASVCHLDASKGMVEWARENAALNQLALHPIRWIVEDAIKFLKREIKRGNHYEAILLDPPTFGRGRHGEVFKIERDISLLIQLCREILSQTPLFLIVSCHTPGFTPTVLAHLLRQHFDFSIDAFEMLLESKEAFSLPSGAAARISFL